MGKGRRRRGTKRGNNPPAAVSVVREVVNHNFTTNAVVDYNSRDTIKDSEVQSCRPTSFRADIASNAPGVVVIQAQTSAAGPNDAQVTWHNVFETQPFLTCATRRVIHLRCPRNVSGDNQARWRVIYNGGPCMMAGTVGFSYKDALSTESKHVGEMLARVSPPSAPSGSGSSSFSLFGN